LIVSFDVVLASRRFVCPHAYLHSCRIVSPRTCWFTY